MNIIECFISVQGEGLRAGRPSLFIRTSGCNLRCVFHNKDGKASSTCDTSYASFNPTNEKKYSIDEAVDVFVQHCVEDVVITGGEPLLDMEGLATLIMKLREVSPYICVTVETNGTIVPDDVLLEAVDLWSVSPKLHSSCPTERDCKKFEINPSFVNLHEKRRINFDALAKIVDESNDCQLKFVYTGPECLDEIKQLRDELQKRVLDSNVNKYIMLMPEGITRKAILDKSEECINVCIDEGWTFSSRLQILVWGNVKEK